MLRHKSTNFISELQNYFSSNEKAITTLFQHLRSLKIFDSQFQKLDKINTQYNGKQIFTLLLMFPLFDVKDISHFAQSCVYQLYKCGKDVLCEFQRTSLINWRKLAYSG